MKDSIFEDVPECRCSILEEVVPECKGKISKDVPECRGSNSEGVV